MKRRSAILRSSTAVLCVCAAAAGTGCRHTIAVEPIEVKPIHMTLDINLKVDRELDEFFDDVETTTAPAPTQPDTSPVPTPADSPSNAAGGQS